MNCSTSNQNYEPLKKQVGNDFATELVEKSSIDPKVALERQYQIANSYELVDLGFSLKQLKGFFEALLIPRRSPDCTTILYQIKPIYGECYFGPKYLIPRGSKMIVDVHPRSLKHIDNVDIPLWITEGAKQADALTSRGLCVASLFGVSTFHVSGTGYKELLPCWDHIAMEDREVIIAFDADAQSNNNVQHALSELVKRLEERNAKVKVIYVSEINGNSKAGVDDWFADGRSLEDLNSLATTFVPVNIADKRLAKDQVLFDNINAMFYLVKTNDWRGKKGKTARSVLKHLTIEASKSGYMVKKGIKIQISQRHLASKVGIQRNTAKNSLDYLIDTKVIEKDRTGLSKGDPDVFILLSKTVPMLARWRETGGIDDRRYSLDDVPYSFPSTTGSNPGHLSLRNSIPKNKPKRGVVAGTSKVRNISIGYEREGIKRLGKKAEHILDIIVDNEGQIPIKDLARTLKIKNQRSLKKFLRDILESVNIVALGERYDEFLNRNLDIVQLTPNWLDMLVANKEITGEYQSAEDQENQHLRDRKNYHQWLDSKVCGTEDMGYIEIMDKIFEAKKESKTEAPVEPAGEDLDKAVIEMLEEIEDLVGNEWVISDRNS